jgi:hypothetical protein
MKPIFFTLAIIIIGAIIAFFGRKDYPYPDGGKAILRDELITISGG